MLFRNRKLIRFAFSEYFKKYPFSSSFFLHIRVFGAKSVFENKSLAESEKENSGLKFDSLS